MINLLLWPFCGCCLSSTISWLVLNIIRGPRENYSSICPHHHPLTPATVDLKIIVSHRVRSCRESSTQGQLVNQSQLCGCRRSDGQTGGMDTMRMLSEHRVGHESCPQWWYLRKSQLQNRQTINKLLFTVLLLFFGELQQTEAKAVFTFDLFAVFACLEKLFAVFYRQYLSWLLNCSLHEVCVYLYS